MTAASALRQVPWPFQHRQELWQNAGGKKNTGNSAECFSFIKINDCAMTTAVRNFALKAKKTKTKTGKNCHRAVMLRVFIL